MIPLAIGLGILGFFAMRRARRHHGRHAYGWYGPWAGGHHGYGHRHRRQRWMLHAALARLDATPAQERVIVNEVEKLQDRVRGAKNNLRDARGDLAAALRGPALDDAALGAVLGRVDTTTGEARSAALDAVRAIHNVLDDKQRGILADMIDHGGGGWRRGPYR